MFGGGDLTGWRVLVSAGGTREAIDPVRFIGNRSSGRMGNAIALAAAERGAAVTLVTTMAPVEHPDIAVLAVETADEMATAVWKTAEDADVAVLAAAVADFRPADPSTGKLRRTDGPPEIALEPTPDILAGVARMQPRPFLVGFAAETGSLDEAVAKAKRKGRRPPGGERRLRPCLRVRDRDQPGGCHHPGRRHRPVAALDQT